MSATSVLCPPKTIAACSSQIARASDPMTGIRSTASGQSTATSTTRNVTHGYRSELSARRSQAPLRSAARASRLTATATTANHGMREPAVTNMASTATPAMRAVANGTRNGVTGRWPAITTAGSIPGTISTAQVRRMFMDGGPRGPQHPRRGLESPTRAPTQNVAAKAPAWPRAQQVPKAPVTPRYRYRPQPLLPAGPPRESRPAGSRTDADWPRIALQRRIP